MKDPKEPREWSDLSDYPQDGWGNIMDIWPEFTDDRYDDEIELENKTEETE